MISQPHLSGKTGTGHLGGSGRQMGPADTDHYGAATPLVPPSTSAAVPLYRLIDQVKSQPSWVATGDATVGLIDTNLDQRSKA